MALINCPECGREISDQAPNCPQCGMPLNKFQPSRPAKSGSGFKWVLLGCAVVLVIIVVVVGFGLYSVKMAGNMITEYSKDKAAVENTKSEPVQPSAPPQIATKPDPAPQPETPFKPKYDKETNTIIVRNHCTIKDDFYAADSVDRLQKYFYKSVSDSDTELTKTLFQLDGTLGKIVIIERGLQIIEVRRGDFTIMGDKRIPWSEIIIPEKEKHYFTLSEFLISQK